MTSDAEEIIDVEARQVVPFVPPATVSLAVSVDEALQQWKDYQRLTRELLDDSDFQKIGGKKFKKKSAWRKYARAFNITDRVTFEDIQRDERGFPIWARIRVEARATNGRTAEADHECHVTERCCEHPCKKATWKDHQCCPEDCDGKRHWSHPGDLCATALTRAKNRAISDLIGAGEVSAEEMTEKHVENETRPQMRGGQQRPAVDGKPARAPICVIESHGACKFVPAGKSKATDKYPDGKPYESFWVCQFPDCAAGWQGRKWSIKAFEWDDILRREENDKLPAETVDYDDVPNE